MTPWTQSSHGSITKGADYLARLCMELQRTLATQGEAACPDEVLFLLSQIAGMAESMSHMGDMAKVRAFLRPEAL